MASSIAAMTMPRSIDFSRATASAICNSSSLLALTAIAQSPSPKLLMIISENRFPSPIKSRTGFSGSFASGSRGEPSMSFIFSRRAHLALGGLLAPQGLRHQFVGEHQLGFAHCLDRKQNLRFLALACVVAAQADGPARGP